MIVAGLAMLVLALVAVVMVLVSSGLQDDEEERGDTADRAVDGRVGSCRSPGRAADPHP